MTGTPVAGRLRDLGGLLAFIRHQPFETTSLFNRTLLVDNDLDKLRRILGEVMLRHRQEDVACDVSIPHLKVPVFILRRHVTASSSSSLRWRRCTCCCRPSNRRATTVSSASAKRYC